MEPLTETIELDLEESNDLTFKIKMEGTAMAPAKVRLVCENDDFAYMFNGYGTGEDEVVQFTLPRMDKKLNEGMYRARVEVLVDNRYFAPLQFQINFKKTLSVVAEAIQVVKKVAKPEVTVTASPISVAKPAPAPAVASTTIKFEQRPSINPVIVAAPEPQKIQIESAPPGSLKDAFLKKTVQPGSLKEKFGK